MGDEDFELFDEESELSLLETLDHVLDRGLVIAGEITISVADIDLIFVGLNVLLGSVETINRTLGGREVGGAGLRGRGSVTPGRAALPAAGGEEADGVSEAAEEGR